MPNCARWVRCAPQFGHVGCCAKCRSAWFVFVTGQLSGQGVTSEIDRNPSVPLDMVGLEGKGDE